MEFIKTKNLLFEGQSQETESPGRGLGWTVHGVARVWGHAGQRGGSRPGGPAGRSEHCGFNTLELFLELYV